MKRIFNFSSILLIAVITLGGYFLTVNKGQTGSGITQNEKLPLLMAGYKEGSPVSVDFEKAAESGVPSVVHIKTITKFRQTSGRRNQQQNPFGDMFGNDEFFKKFFGDNDGAIIQPDQKASGSGVIIRNDGYIVTNNHVVDGATEVLVTLSNRKDYKAKVIGTDQNTDLALLKIDAKDLPVMQIGNSDEVHLGQWVLAIGYPLNLDVTVTQGIVSAKSRNIGINRQGAAPVEAFIQTDAAVNPGSSGGALVNTDGELIGINSAIASPTGSYAGYAYAIPANLMKKVIGDIMKFGTVQRGYLGIGMAPEDLDNAGKKELGISENALGVYVMEVDPDGAAAKAGIRKGDVINRIDGITIETNAQLSEQVARRKPGDKVLISYTRGSGQYDVTATLIDKLGSFASQVTAAIESLGAEFKTMSKSDAEKAGISGGVQVTSINDGIISDQTNMKPGFVITKINGNVVKTVEDMKQAISKQDNNLQIEGFYPGSKEIYYYGINDLRK